LLVTAALLGLLPQPALHQAKHPAKSERTSPQAVVSGSTVPVCRYGQEQINPQTGRKQTCR